MLRANCTSKHSKPAANLTWTINEMPVSVKLIISLLNFTFALYSFCLHKWVVCTYLLLYASLPSSEVTYIQNILSHRIALTQLTTLQVEQNLVNIGKCRNSIWILLSCVSMYPPPVHIHLPLPTHICNIIWWITNFLQ